MQKPKLIWLVIPALILLFLAGWIPIEDGKRAPMSYYASPTPTVVIPATWEIHHLVNNKRAGIAPTTISQPAVITAVAGPPTEITVVFTTPSADKTHIPPPCTWPRPCSRTPTPTP